MLYDLCPANNLQGSLIADPEAKVHSYPNALMDALDRINVNFTEGSYALSLKVRNMLLSICVRSTAPHGYNELERTGRSQML